MNEYFNKRIKLANLPTPIQKLNRLTRHLNGPELSIKRDDYTGLELTGNKIRKLEFILNEAINNDVNVIISCGGIQSNHIRTCAAAAAKLGIKAHLVIWANKSDAISGNSLLYNLTDAEISYYQAENIEDMNKNMQMVAEKYRKKGYNPMVIPLGASSPLGVLGYVHAVKEMNEQFRRKAYIPDYIVTAVGTGSTYLGLLLGVQLYKLPIKIVGINVIDENIDYKNILGEEWNRFCDYFKVSNIFDSQLIEINSNYTGEGYGKLQKEINEVIAMLAALEGIFLDPVYTGKTVYGLCQEIKKGRFKKDEKVLFLHTGGIFGLFKQH